MPLSRAGASGQPGASTPSPRPYLIEVEGLRTVAALLVAFYHIWFHRVSGGVDVFFVVAGFFATLALLKLAFAERPREQAKIAGSYLLRTLRRILPSSVVVITATVIAGIIFMPKSLWDSTLTHGLASMLFVENWELIQTEADYLQREMIASPFQQFWALSVQTQFYLGYAVVLLLGTLIARKLRMSGRAMILAIVIVTFVASFACSVILTSYDQPNAYFNTLARLWEFAAGAILAILMTRSLRPSIWLKIIGWVGLAALILFGAVADMSELLPGAIALVPVGAAICMIVSAYGGSAPAVLRWRPLVAFAKSSFAFYLWHWPILVFYRLLVQEDVSFLGGLFILGVSAVLAVATTEAVEAPVRNSPRLQRSAIATLVAVALLSVPAFASLGGWRVLYDRAYTATAADDTPGGQGGTAPSTLVPSVAKARDDLVDSYSNGCHQNLKKSEVIVCTSVGGDDDPKIVVVGGSHSVQWLDLVRQVAADEGYQVVAITKSACVFGDLDKLEEDGLERRNASCVEWIDNVLDMLLQDRPEIVLTIGTRLLDGTEVVPEGYVAYFEKLSEAGINVIALRDNPRFEEDVPACVELRGADACAIDRDRIYVDIDELDIPDLPGFTFVDTADSFCDATTCPVVDDGILMYRDGHHLTRTWTVERGERIAERIREVMQAVR